MLRQVFLASLLVLAPVMVAAQEAAGPPLAVPRSDLDPLILKYTGEPLRVPFACTEDQLQAAGLYCTEKDPCPIYLELNAIASAGKRLSVAGDLHSTSGTIESLLLTSDDAGTTWKESAERVPASALDQIQFHDLEHGWAAGEVQYPLPGDPFVLITSDGGQTWRRSSITEEGPGSVLKFWFDSAKHGEAIVDAGKPSGAARYMLFETEDGGDSWTLKSAAGSVPALKRSGGSGEPPFRIRAIGEKSYLIEKRSGEAKWETLAAFLVDAASCRPK